MTNYKSQYCDLKRKLKFLIYENECFQEALRSTQRQLLKANRDKSFLLDRLLPYERVDASLSDSDEQTDSSEEEDMKVEFFKRRKSDVVLTGQSTNFLSVTVKSQQLHKKKKPIVKSMKTSDIASMDTDKILPSLISDGHMTPEEVERHLESRQNYLELVPEKAPPTVPTEMFSNDVSLDKLE